MSATEIELSLLSNLPNGVQEVVFAKLKKLYTANFPLPDEQQTAEDWRLPVEPGKPQAVVLTAGTGYDKEEAVEVWGGAVAEYYPKSRCGLLAYLFVDSSRRGLGIGRKLVDESINYLIRVAGENDQIIHARHNQFVSKLPKSGRR